MKRFLTLTLALLMLISVLCACANTNDPSGSDTTPSGGNSADTTPSGNGSDTTTDKYYVENTMPELNYNKDIVTILSRSRSWYKDEVSVESQNGEVINDAVYERNMKVEDQLNIKINNILMDTSSGNGNYDVPEAIKTQVMSGTNEYDLMVNSVYSSLKYIGENIYANLYDCEYLDLENTYWLQGFNDAASIGKAQYFATGAICLSSYRFIFATFFNRQMFADAGLDLPYQTVNDGKWTLDYQYEISSNLYKDTNGNQERDEDDIYGFVTCGNMIGVDPYWSACKVPIITKDADNWLAYSLDVERLTAAVEKVNRLIWNNDGGYSVKHLAQDAEQDVIADMFANDRAAMVTLRLIEAEGAYLKNMSSDYGIVPLPKLDEQQDNYQSYAHDSFTGYAIPNNLTDEDLQEMGAVMEAMAAESYRTVLPAYYEVTLKDRYCNDPESRDMLDTIINSFYVDPGVLYTLSLNNIHQLFRNFVGAQNNNVASTVKSYKKTMPTYLEKLQSSIRDIQDRND